MAGIRLQPEDSDVSQQSRAVALSATDLVSDDDRSVAADSWSIKSEYGSTLDDDQRHADAAEALSNANLRPPSDYSSDKDEPDSEAVTSMLGFQSYWDSAYADELTNFREHGHTGEVWFGVDVMEVVASWTKALCVEISQGHIPNGVDEVKAEADKLGDKVLSTWSVLDIGTGNGLLLQELAKQGRVPLAPHTRTQPRHPQPHAHAAATTSGSDAPAQAAATSSGSDASVTNGGLQRGVLAEKMKLLSRRRRRREEEEGILSRKKSCHLFRFSDLTGTDYSERAISLAQSLANRDGFSNVKFLVDDVLETKLEQEFRLVMDKGTLDAIGLHPDGPVKRMMYWDSVSRLVASGGILDELVQEVESFNQRKIATAQELGAVKDEEPCREPPFQLPCCNRGIPSKMKMLSFVMIKVSGRMDLKLFLTVVSNSKYLFAIYVKFHYLSFLGE
ncbi:hypothetical protein JHK85_003754 [Glycine max]|nr:hypothetical protein JHK85_003754 [Glycine max]